MLAGLKVPSLACKRGFYRTEHEEETPWNRILKVLKCRNEIYQRTEFKE